MKTIERFFSWLLLALLLAWRTSARSHAYEMGLVSNVGKFTCEPGRLFKDAVPKGIATVNVDHLKVLGTGDISAEECLRRCCRLGQQQCQYLWVFGETCFSVGCDNGRVGCSPQLLPAKVRMDSVYVKMQYVVREEDLDDVEETLDNHLGHDDENDNEKGHSPSKERAPVADAGGDVTVQLPVSVVHLYGNGSKADQGIKSYLWELISDHFVHPMLENSDGPILQVKNLIPGHYTFRLTVVDQNGQSNSAVVDVHVLEGRKSSETKTESMAPPHPTTVGLSSKTGQTTTNASEADIEGKAEEDENEDYLRKRRIVLKIVVPVLLSVAGILTISAVIVGVSACLCERNRRRMKRFYRYKRIPETIEKT